MTKRHRSGGNYTKTQSDICRAKLKIRIRDQDQPEQQNGATQQEQADATSSWLNLPISMVSSAVETRTYPTTCGEVLEGIRSGKWEKLVKRVSSGYAKAFETAVEEGKPDPAVAAKKAVHTKKRELPAVTWSGAFSERVDSAIESHSGLLCVDVDNCQDPADIRAKLANDPYIQAAFISPTGTGCKALVRIPPQAVAHAQSFAAARKHFKEAHNVTIDEACKNLSRLCYIAHDADAFIRNEEAEILEPLPLEKPEAPKRETEQEEDVIPAGLMKLPEAGLVTNSESAESIFNKILEQEPPVMYLRAGRVVTIEEKNQLDGKSEVVIEDLSPAAFRSAVEKCGTLFAYYAPRGQLLIKPKALMSADIANVLLASEERKRLPPVWLIHRCPILVEKDGESFLLGKGYHREFGGRYIACGGEIDIKIPLDQAVDALLELFEEFDFVTRADKARAVTSMIMPALRFGGLLRCHFPALLVEADHSQAGKGTLVEMNQLVYNERAGMAPKRQRGVGSFDEDLSAKMLEGRVFIQPDNIRSALNSEFFESCLTCPPNTTILARGPL